MVEGRGTCPAMAISRVFHDSHVSISRTYVAFDTKNPAILIAEMKKNGVNMGLCGVSGVRLRPMLTFEETHGKLTLFSLFLFIVEFSNLTNFTIVRILIETLAIVLGEISGLE